MLVRFYKNGKQVFSVVTWNISRAVDTIAEWGISWDRYKKIAI